MDDDETTVVTSTVIAFAREHSIWLIGLVPVLIVGLDVLILSRGNSQILGYILRGMTVSTVIFGIFLPMVPVLFIIFLIPWLALVRFSSDYGIGWSSYTKLMVDMITFVVAFIVFAACPIQWIIVVLLIDLALGVTALISGKLRSRRRLHYGIEDDAGAPSEFLWIPLVLGTVLAVLVMDAARWAPYENVALEHGPTYAAQVLSTDSEWTVLLSADRRIVIAHTKDVASRQPCSWGFRAVQLLGESPLDFNRKPNPPCVEKIPTGIFPQPQKQVLTSVTSTPPNTTHPSPRP
jgi:hypothetical protein